MVMVAGRVVRRRQVERSRERAQGLAGVWAKRMTGTGKACGDVARAVRAVLAVIAADGENPWRRRHQGELRDQDRGEKAKTRDHHRPI